MEKKAGMFTLLLVCLSVVIGLHSCQDLYTTGIFGFLQTDPEDLSRDRLIDYGWDAIGTGDEKKMQKAYDAVKEALKDDPDDAELNYLAAYCALELSGITDIIISQPADYVAFKNGLDTAHIIEAGTYFDTAVQNGAALNVIDIFFCGTGLLLDTVGGDFSLLPSIDFVTPPANQQTGVAYVIAGYYGIADIDADLALSFIDCFFPGIPV
jgi:hypothetical protein